MSLFSKLFGGGGSTKKEADPVDHNGYLITPTPMKEAQGYRVAARIQKGERTHEMIRADTYGSPEVAAEASVSKAKQFIDQQGEGIFR